MDKALCLKILKIREASHQPLAASKPAAVVQEQKLPGALVHVRYDRELLSGLQRSLEIVNGCRAVMETTLEIVNPRKEMDRRLGFR